MSRSSRGEKLPGSDWWNRRPLSGYQAGAKSRSKNKQICNQIERAQERNLIRNEIKELDDTSSLTDQAYIGKLYALQFSWLDLLGAV